ncbi:nicotinamide phosphoribosyl transferase [Vibrio phage D181]
MYDQVSADGFTDSYKVGMSMLHELNIFGCAVQISNSYSNFTPRKNAYMTFCDQSSGHIVAYGMRDTFQNVIDMWDRTFFQVDRAKMLKKLTRRIRNHFGSITEHKKFLEDMGELHDLGYLPIEVRSIDEGTRYPLGLPLFTVKATVDGYGWLVNFIETLTSGLIWPMTNTATKVEQFYLQAKHYGELSAPQEIVDMWLPICVHEFGMRGYRGPQDQVRTSSAHSLFFIGSDTQAVIDFFEDSYDANSDEEAIAVSVRASEHADISRMLSLFRHLAQAAIDKDGEDATLPFEGQVVSARDVLDNTEFYVLAYFIENSTGIMSYVSDTENFYRLINVYAKQLAERIEARKERADGQPPIFVFRPDSSRRTPLTVICGYKIIEVTTGGGPDDNVGILADDECMLFEGKYYLMEKGVSLEITKEEAEGSLISLWNTFGGEEVETKAGLMKLINPAVGLIYGEAISQSHQKEIYERMIEMGFSAVNVLIGKGSFASLENSTRDLFSMSYKQTFSEALIDGKSVNLAQQKTPMGDQSKKSARGLLCVDYVDTHFHSTGNPEFILEQDVTEEREQEGCLTLLLRDGTFSKLQTLSGIKETYASKHYYHLAD